VANTADTTIAICQRTSMTGASSGGSDIATSDSANTDCGMIECAAMTSSTAVSKWCCEIAFAISGPGSAAASPRD
jgi:ribosomal protein S11